MSSSGGLVGLVASCAPFRGQLQLQHLRWPSFWDPRKGGWEPTYYLQLLVDTLGSLNTTWESFSRKSDALIYTPTE